MIPPCPAAAHRRLHLLRLHDCELVAQARLAGHRAGRFALCDAQKFAAPYECIPMTRSSSSAATACRKGGGAKENVDEGPDSDRLKQPAHANAVAACKDREHVVHAEPRCVQMPTARSANEMCCLMRAQSPVDRLPTFAELHRTPQVETEERPTNSHWTRPCGDGARPSMGVHVPMSRWCTQRLRHSRPVPRSVQESSGGGWASCAQTVHPRRRRAMRRMIWRSFTRSGTEAGSRRPRAHAMSRKSA